MTLIQLRYFCTAARYHSISRAAKELFVTQPTVSIAIKDLEKEFGIILFTHANNQLTLTEEGEAFFQKASEILSTCDDFCTEFAGVRHVQSRVRIGIPPILSMVYFPELMDAFHQKYPNIWLELQEFGSIRACDLVQDEVLDIGLVNMEIHNIDKFHTQVLTKEKLYYCVCEGHELEKEEFLELQQLHEKSLIIYSQDSVQNQILQARFNALQIRPHIVMHSNQLPTILKFLRQKHCGCFLYGSVLAQIPELIGIPLVPEMVTRTGIVWKRGRYMNSGTQAFINFCREYYLHNGVK